MQRVTFHNVLETTVVSYGVHICAALVEANEETPISRGVTHYASCVDAGEGRSPKPAAFSCRIEIDYLPLWATDPELWTCVVRVMVQDPPPTVQVGPGYPCMHCPGPLQFHRESVLDCCLCGVPREFRSCVLGNCSE